MNQHANIDIKDGLSQSERFPRALHPSYFKPDERDTGHLLNFTIELARLFNYYNVHNQPEGTWEEFFDLDMDVLFTLIARIDLKSALRDYEQLQIALLQAETPSELVLALNDVLAYLFNALDILVKTRVKSGHARNNNQVLPVAGITADCYQLSARFIQYYSQIIYMLPQIIPLNVAALLPTPLLFPLEASDKPIDNLFVYPSQKKATAAIHTVLSALFGELRQKYSQLIAAARYYLQHQQKDREYDAHLGLYMAFLQLYGHLQQQMNKITQRHLDFYYQQVLAIERRPAIPDRVHIVCQPAPQINRFVLPAGELLLAEIAATGQTAVYQTNSEAVIGRAVIKELKTGFVSRQVQFPAGNKFNYQPVEEIKVYKGDYPVVGPAVYTEGACPVPPWPLMGEEQAGLPQSRRTMDDAAIGLLLASPLLYVRDGIRHIHVRFYLTAQSWEYFEDYIRNFSGITGNNDAITAHQLLSKAFVIRITGEEGWMEIEKYSLRFNRAENNDPYLDLNYKLYATDEPVGIYNSSIHGDNYDVTTPAMKLEINNTSFHNAFGFLRNMEISRITIQVQVTGSRVLQLQNNLGPLSAVTPFQAFGPVPATGSYLDIKNTNIFNRFTRSFNLAIEWFDLPSAAGGFETYFQGYQNHIRNESFTVSIAPLHNGKSQVMLPAQQVISLFNTWRDENRQVFLSRETFTPELGGAGFAFTNVPLLDEEQEVKGLFREGAVRIELTGPADAFGHRLYPVLFPAAIMHNAKRFVKKIPTPEQPYIPVIKSIEVNYTLEHSEVLTGRGRDKEDSFVTVAHIYPFGQKMVYPEKDTADVTFVPHLDHESNLMIGLQQVMPGQPLSFLFQVQEMKFHHTAHDTENIQWSYLKNNQWYFLKSSDVLSDSTHNFIESGVVVLQLPDDLQTGNTILNPDCCWIKASINGSRTGGARLVGLFTQVVTATRVPDAAAPQTLYSTWLPPASVKGFKRKIPEITQAWQLFPSTEGRPEETRQQYYLRISERLRHKQRPRTNLDISQVILDAFPEILMVKCIGAGTEKHLVLPAINLQVIVIPREREDGRFLSRQPGVSLDTLFRIKAYISKQLSAFATVEVGNPVYEKIKIVCSIQIRQDGVNTNDGYYIKLLNEDIGRYINPWLYGEGHELRIGGKIYIQDILDDIKRKPYVNYVTAFSVLHFYRKQDMLSGRFESVVVDSAVEKNQYLSASRPDAVLISSDTHLVTIMNSPDYRSPSASGIGDFIAGDELTVYPRLVAAERPEEVPLTDDNEWIDIHFDL